MTQGEDDWNSASPHAGTVPTASNTATAIRNAGSPSMCRMAVSEPGGRPGGVGGTRTSSPNLQNARTRVPQDGGVKC